MISRRAGALDPGCALFHHDDERHRLRHLMVIGAPASCARHVPAPAGTPGGTPAGTSGGTSAAVRLSGRRRWPLSTPPPPSFGAELASIDRLISYLLRRP
ncbi:hypothetical protein [Actinomadura rupiterrae]|uniref:hypothetical protein n=1 Tax=Actinomadura rupiterrae TaxID=559627 RepID=UPI0020A3FD37|nr:hypothetical protein [Actinomadura rupiterrae]MCP2337417.1 hypothetical protein [Actinomadura rupiterrae]